MNNNIFFEISFHFQTGSPVLLRTASYDEFVGKSTMICGACLVDDLVFKYVDNDGDLITFSTREEFEEIRYVKESPVKVEVTKKISGYRKKLENLKKGVESFIERNKPSLDIHQYVSLSKAYASYISSIVNQKSEESQKLVSENLQSFQAMLQKHLSRFNSENQPSSSLSSSKKNGNIISKSIFVEPRCQSENYEEMEKKIPLLSDFVRKVHFLKNRSNLFISAIVRKLQPRTYKNSEFLIKQGEVGREMFFLSSGKVAVSVGNREIAELGAGCFFGEIALCKDNLKRTASVCAIGDVKCYILSNKVFSGVGEMFPEEMKTVRMDIKKSNHLEKKKDSLKKKMEVIQRKRNVNVNIRKKKNFKYSKQLALLRCMGFEDKSINIFLLNENKGNIKKVLEIFLK